MYIAVFRNLAVMSGERNPISVGDFLVSNIEHREESQQCSARRYAAATGSIKLGSLFLTSPMRALTGQQTIPSEGKEASNAFKCASQCREPPRKLKDAS